MNVQGYGRSEIYFIAAMMLLILFVCGVVVYFFFKTYKTEMAEKARRKSKTPREDQSE